MDDNKNVRMRDDCMHEIVPRLRMAKRRSLGEREIPLRESNSILDFGKWCEEIVIDGCAMATETMAMIAAFRFSNQNY